MNTVIRPTLWDKRAFLCSQGGVMKPTGKIHNKGTAEEDCGLIDTVMFVATIPKLSKTTTGERDRWR